MSVALRTITRLQDADDINVSLGAGVDEYALCWDNDTAKFVLRAVAGGGVTDHGALTGLTPDDDHTQYALLAGRAGGQTLYGGTAANDDITIHGTSDSTRTTSYVLLQPTAGNVGIGTSAPSELLHIRSASSDVALRLTVSGDYWPYLRLERTNGSTKTNRVWGFFVNSLGDFNFTDESSGLTPLYITRAAPDNSFRISGAGLVGIGTAAPATLLHVTSTTATTGALRNVLTLGSNVTSPGAGAAGLGAAVLFTMETTTTVDTNAASVQAIWYEATHATRKADLVLTAYDTAEREGLRIRGNGSAAAIGFLGATPQARIAHVADPAGGATVDAEARSAINSILSTLELFGLHATS